MNKLIFTIVVLASPLVMCYDEKFDKMDVDNILNDDAKLKAYIDCLLEKGPCDNVQYGDDFKKMFPEIIETGCGKCNKIQKTNMRKIFKTLKEKLPEAVVELSDKYDPTKQHVEKFMQFLTGTD